MNTIILSSEQAAEWDRYRCVFTAEELAEGDRMMASVTPEEAAEAEKLLDVATIESMAERALSTPPKPFTLTYAVEPQPERVPFYCEYGMGERWSWRADPYGNDVDLHAAILAHWWTETCGNRESFVYADKLHSVKGHTTPFRDSQPVPGPVEFRTVNAGGGLQFYSDATLVSAVVERVPDQFIIKVTIKQQSG